MADTRILAVIGDPVAASLSPRMQNAAIGAAGIDAAYIALRTTPTAFTMLVQELLKAGGACNVTMPFKEAALALPGGQPTAVAVRTRAVNCVWGEAEGPQLDNTDVPAIRVVARRLVGDAPVSRVRLFGTGGAARAAAVAVADEWPEATIEVVSRSPERAQAFVTWAGGAGVRGIAEADIMTELDLMIHATPVDVTAGAYPVSNPGPGATYDPPAPPPALDLAYAPGGTSLVRMMRQAGLRAEDGRGVLVEQGGLAFERFFGAPAPLDVMRAAVEYALQA